MLAGSCNRSNVKSIQETAVVIHEIRALKHLQSMLENYERYKKRRVAATSSLSSLSGSETELVEVSGTFKALTDEGRAAVSNMASKLPSDRLENGWYLRPEDRPTTERCRDEGQLYILIVPAFTYGNIRADDNEGHRHLMARGGRRGVTGVSGVVDLTINRDESSLDELEQVQVSGNQLNVGSGLC